MLARDRACNGVGGSLLANTSEDIEKKRHKRNPFGLRYIQLLSTPWDKDEPADLEPDDAKEAVDSAAADIHVRIELLKTMKQALLKQTAEEVRQSKSERSISIKAAAKPKQELHRQQVARKDVETGDRTCSPGETALQLFEEIIAGRDINISNEELRVQLASNPCTRTDGEIAFDASALAPETFEELRQRLFPAESRPHHEQGWSSQSSHTALIRNEDLLQGIASCIGKLVLQDGWQDHPEAGAASRSIAPAQLPTYLQDITRSVKRMESQADTAKRDTHLSQTGHVEVSNDDCLRAELPSHFLDTDGSDTGNIVFAAKGDDRWLPQLLDPDPEHGCSLPEAMLPLTGMLTDSVHSDREGPSNTARSDFCFPNSISLADKRRRAPTLKQWRSSAAMAAASPPSQLPGMAGKANAALDILLEADGPGFGTSEVIGAPEATSHMPTTTARPMTKPRIRKRPTLWLGQARTQRMEAGSDDEDDIEDQHEFATPDKKDNGEALASVTIEPNYTLDHLASLHADSSCRHPSAKKAAYKPVPDPECLLQPIPPPSMPVQPGPCLAPQQLMQVFVTQLQQPHQPWAALVERAAEQHSAEVHQPACGGQHQSSVQQRPGSMASDAKPPESFTLGRPATAKEIMSGLKVRGQAKHSLQQELPLLGSGHLSPAYSSQPAACPAREPPSALGVFAVYSSDEEDDDALLQAAMEAEQQHGVPCRVLAKMGCSAVSTSQPGGALDGREMTGHTSPLGATGRQLHVPESRTRAKQDHMQKGIPGIIYDCSNTNAVCQAPKQLEGLQGPDKPEESLSMQGRSPPSQAGPNEIYAEDAFEKGSDVYLAGGKGPAPEDAPDDVVFCDAQDTAWPNQPAPLPGQEGGARSESQPRPLATYPPPSCAQPAIFGNFSKEERCRISADQAGWHSNVQRCTVQQVGPSAAVQKATELPGTRDHQSRASIVRALDPKSLDPDSELEDIQMMTDGSDDEAMQQGIPRQKVATASEPTAAIALADGQSLHVSTHDSVGHAQDQASEQAFQPDWAQEDEDSEGIIFDDTAVDFATRWMHSDSDSQPVGPADDTMGLEQQPVRTFWAEAHARQKRAREELCDKLIQELLEDSGRSTRLEPLIAHTREHLAARTPEASGLYPTSLQELRHGCINAKVPGSETSLQRHMFALLTHVQRINTGQTGAGRSLIAGRWQLKLESAHSRHDVHIHRVPSE